MTRRKKFGTWDDLKQAWFANVKADVDEALEEYEMGVVSAADLSGVRKRSFLWNQHIPYGAVTAIEGPKGVGKSALLAAIAAHATSGPHLPLTNAYVNPRTVLWFTGEEDPVLDVCPKLEAAGAQIPHVHFPGRDKEGKRTARLRMPDDIILLLELIVGLKASVVVFDPWSYCHPCGGSPNEPVTARRVMESLSRVAQETGAAVLVTRNFRKTWREGPSIASGIGSFEVANVARSVIQLLPHPHEDGAFVCCVVAANGFKAPHPRAYKLIQIAEAVAFRWQETLTQSVGQVMERRPKPRDADEFSDASSVLRDVLEGQWVKFTVLRQHARRAGVCERTLRAAKAKFRIPSRRVTEKGRVSWEWGPPPTEECPSAS